MKKKPITVVAKAGLRRQAEARLRERPPRRGSEPGVARRAVNSERLHHQLQVHQVELETQNAELQESRNRMEILVEKYTDLYDFAPVGYFSLDPQGRILEMNLTGAALLGLERTQLMNGLLRRFISPKSQPVFLDFLQRIFAGPAKQLCEIQLRKGGSAVSWASFHGVAAIARMGTARWCRVAVSDITARKLAEELLRRNEALFSDLIEQAPVGVYVVDDQLRLQQINPKAQPLFGKVRHLSGRDLSEILHLLWPVRIAREILEHFQRTLRTGQPYNSPEFSERRRDIGLQECYEWQLQRITLPAGRHGVVCFINNTTERKRQESIQHRLELLAASNQKLEQEVVHRKAVEKSLKQSEQHHSRLLKQSRQMQGRLQQLSRQILLAQEEERKRISRELHDVIAQTLTGINVRLAALKKAATSSPDLEENIARTQQLIEHSVNIVHQFARELRPTLLDDLGLIPALYTFLKGFKAETGIHVSLSAFAEVERVNGDKRTVLYRIAQEALTNVARHAQATRVDLTVQKVDGLVRMTITDNGKGFAGERVLETGKSKRLGLLGMRERLEMVGGNFTIISAPGRGATVQAQIPLETIYSPRGGKKTRPQDSSMNFKAMKPTPTGTQGS